MDTKSARDVVLAHAGRHQQQRFPSFHDSLLGRRGTNGRLYCFALLARQWQRHRPRPAVRARDPRLRIDHHFPLHDLKSFGQIFGERH
jgi:hypothetical protein